MKKIKLKMCIPALLLASILVGGSDNIIDGDLEHFVSQVQPGAKLRDQVCMGCGTAGGAWWINGYA
jgi:hypothetical protein